MVKLNKIYTKTGDAGETGLVGGTRIAKASKRVEAMGVVDEANSAIGVVRLSLKDQAEYNAMLHRIQHDLFDLGADLATPVAPDETVNKALRIVPEQIMRLEQEIDGMNVRLPPLTSFVLPGGSPAAAQLYFARAIVRRAECAICELMATDTIGPQVLPYINRLSDHLFVMARAVNIDAKEDGAEVLWQPGVNR